MKLSKKEKSYIYDRVKWYGYNLGSTKDFIVKLYFFEEEDYSENDDGTIAAYYTSMNELFKLLADRGIEYKEAIDIDGYFYVEFSSKEIYKYIKYDINKGKKRKKLTPLERRLERESDKRIEEFLKNEFTGNLEDIQPFMSGRALFTIEESDPFENLGIEVTPYEEVDTKNNSIVKRIVDNVNKELEKIKDKYFPHETDENDPVKKLYRGEATEEEKEEIFNNIHKEYRIKGNILMGDDAKNLILKSSEENADAIKELRNELKSIYEDDDKVRVLEEGESVENRIYVDEDGNPERADVKVKMNPEDAMLAYIKGLAEFRRKQTGEDIRVVNEEGEEL